MVCSASNRNAVSTIATDWPCTHNCSPGVNHSFSRNHAIKVICRQNLTIRIRRQLLATATNPPKDRPPDQEPQTDSPHTTSLLPARQLQPPFTTKPDPSTDIPLPWPPIPSPSMNTARDDHLRQESSNPPPNRPRTRQTPDSPAHQHVHPGCLQ
jgi:hypothetical protein